MKLTSKLHHKVSPTITILSADMIIDIKLVNTAHLTAKWNRTDQAIKLPRTNNTTLTKQS